MQLIEAAEPAENAVQLADRLRETMAPVAPSVAVWAAALDDAPEVLPPAENKRWLRYWAHHGAGSIAGRGNIYSSRLKHLPIEGTEADGPASAMNTIRDAIQGHNRSRPSHPLGHRRRPRRSVGKGGGSAHRENHLKELT